MKLHNPSHAPKSSAPAAKSSNPSPKPPAFQPANVAAQLAKSVFVPSSTALRNASKLLGGFTHPLDSGGIDALTRKQSGKGAHRMKIGGNYTDLGVLPNGQMPTDAATMKKQVEEEMQRLLAAGVKDLRIWAQPPSDPELMKLRIQFIAEFAQKNGMTVTVDLKDMHRDHAEDPGAHQLPGIDNELRQLFEQVVRPNARYSSLRWSLGNEPSSGANNPNFKPQWNQDFANWYAKMNGELARIVGRGKTVAELTPSAVGMPPDPRAMKTLLGSVGSVSLHYYPPGNITDPASFAAKDGEFQALMAWKKQADAMGKPFQIGEFGLPNDLPPDVRFQRLDAWLNFLESQGVKEVKLWQFLKNEVGHIDGLSFDDNDAIGRDFDLSDQLRRNHWLPG